MTRRGVALTLIWPGFILTAMALLSAADTLSGPGRLERLGETALWTALAAACFAPSYRLSRRSPL